MNVIVEQDVAREDVSKIFPGYKTCDAPTRDGTPCDRVVRERDVHCRSHRS